MVSFMTPHLSHNQEIWTIATWTKAKCPVVTKIKNIQGFSFQVARPIFASCYKDVDVEFCSLATLTCSSWSISASGLSVLHRRSHSLASFLFGKGSVETHRLFHVTFIRSKILLWPDPTAVPLWGISSQMSFFLLLVTLPPTAELPTIEASWKFIPNGRARVTAAVKLVLLGGRFGLICCHERSIDWPWGWLTELTTSQTLSLGFLTISYFTQSLSARTYREALTWQAWSFTTTILLEVESV